MFLTKALLLVLLILGAHAAKSSRKAKKEVEIFSGSTSQRLKWKDQGVNLVSTTVDLKQHNLKTPAAIFTSLSSSNMFQTKRSLNGLDIDLSKMDEYLFSNYTGKYLPTSTSLDSFTLKLSNSEGSEKNLTASAANVGNYKIKYVGYTRNHPFEAGLFEKYEDVLPNKDFSILLNLSYLEFLMKFFNEDKDVIKPLLGRDYVKPESDAASTTSKSS